LKGKRGQKHPVAQKTRLTVLFNWIERNNQHA
jgi:hypothetical protein